PPKQRREEGSGRLPALEPMRSRPFPREADEAEEQQGRRGMYRNIGDMVATRLESAPRRVEPQRQVDQRASTRRPAAAGGKENLSERRARLQAWVLEDGGAIIKNERSIKGAEVRERDHE